MSLVCVLFVIAFGLTILSMVNPSKCPLSVPVLLLTIAGLLGCWR